MRFNTIVTVFASALMASAASSAAPAASGAPSADAGIPDGRQLGAMFRALIDVQAAPAPAPQKRSVSEDEFATLMEIFASSDSEHSKLAARALSETDSAPAATANGHELGLALGKYFTEMQSQPQGGN